MFRASVFLLRLTFRSTNLVESYSLFVFCFCFFTLPSDMFLIVELVELELQKLKPERRVRRVPLIVFCRNFIVYC